MKLEKFGKKTAANGQELHISITKFVNLPSFATVFFFFCYNQRSIIPIESHHVLWISSYELHPCDSILYIIILTFLLI